MLPINRLIQETVNPFDSTLFRPGNFWQETLDPRSEIHRIHGDVVTAINETVDLTISDQRSRTILLAGDSGSGKSHLLGRLKRDLNRKAFFAYVGPWPESDYIWRHTLRYTIDSLMYVPEGQTQSQLMLWLKRLVGFRDEGGLLQRMIGARNVFVRNLKAAHPGNIFNANEFFSVLYHLTDPERYALACEWLKGDDLDEESLNLLNVNRSIETETQAQNLLSNFGRIAGSSQPIVLCFDNLDNVDQSHQGHIDLQALFNVNSIIHNQKLKNLVVIISIITNTWNENARYVQPADLARIDEQLRLRPINLDLAAELWKTRLAPLHAQATEATLPSPLYPLSEADLAIKFPGGKALPRSVLMFGRQQFQTAKQRLQTENNLSNLWSNLSDPSTVTTHSFNIDQTDVNPKNSPQLDSQFNSNLNPQFSESIHDRRAERAEVDQDTNRFTEISNPEASTSQPSQSANQLPVYQLNQQLTRLSEFRLLWQHTLKQASDRVTTIRQFSEPERIQMLREVLEILGVRGIQPKLLSSRTYSRYSLGFYWSFEVGRVGVIWVEEPNLVSFCNVMKACQRAIRDDLCQFLYLIRAENLGVPRNQGYRYYRKLFIDSVHRHIIPDLGSMQFLAAYHDLLTAAIAGDLILGTQSITAKELQALVLELDILQDCNLLHKLGVFGAQGLSSLLSRKSQNSVDKSSMNSSENLTINSVSLTSQANLTPSTTQTPISEFMFALVQTQQFMGRLVLRDSVIAQFPKIQPQFIEWEIERLIADGLIQILDPHAPIDAQLICCVI